MFLLNQWDKVKKLTHRFAQPHKRSRLERYVFPLILIALFYVIKLMLYSVFGQQLPYLLSTFIIVLSSWYGGFGPGIFATLLTGILSYYLFLEPRLSFIGPENAISTFIFILQGLFISMISEAKRYTDIQKDEFISFASHELKNPLAVIKGYNSLLQRLVKKKKYHKLKSYLVKTDEQIDRVTALINELLDVTKIESGKLTLQKEAIDIYSMVKDIIRDQQIVAETHRIILTGKTKKKVYADKIRIGEVLTNLLTNAVKYSPGKKKVVVTIKNKRGSVLISVQDFGIGLSDEDQQRIFERFYRVPDTQVQGLGLGLFISRQIVKLHNGRLWLESIKGKGTTFYCQLPTG